MHYPRQSFLKALMSIKKQQSSNLIVEYQSEVTRMEWFHKFSEWNTAKQEKHRSEMRAMGLCPDCNGRGFIPTIGLEYTQPLDCSGCDGTGLYNEWHEQDD